MLYIVVYRIGNEQLHKKCPFRNIHCPKMNTNWLYGKAPAGLKNMLYIVVYRIGNEQLHKRCPFRIVYCPKMNTNWLHGKAPAGLKICCT